MLREYRGSKKGGSMESRGKMGRGKGSGFDPQLGRQWGKFVGFLGDNRIYAHSPLA